VPREYELTAEEFNRLRFYSNEIHAVPIGGDAKILRVRRDVGYGRDIKRLLDIVEDRAIEGEM
jgi:hypothetical protein